MPAVAFRIDGSGAGGFQSPVRAIRSEDMNMMRTHTGNPGTPERRRTAWAERAIVLGGFAVAALHTAVSAILGTGMEAAGPLWLAAILWTVPSSLVLALRQGFVRGDWSAFRNHEFPGDDGDLDEWSSRTGRYQYLADMEDLMLRDDDHLR